MPELIIHEDPISANCYKIRLTAALTSQHLTCKAYSTLKGETRTAEFLQNVSSFGRIPVLQIDDGTFLPESNAACWFIAEQAQSSLIPANPRLRAETLRWMFFEQNQHETSIATLRFWMKYIGQENLDAVKRAQLAQKTKQAEEVLDCMNEHLGESQSGWFVGPGVTLGDVVLYAYTHRAHEAGFDLAKWPHITSWCQRIESLEKYVRMWETSEI